MDIIGFLILLVISIVVSFVLHFPLRYYVNPGWWSFGSKVVIGWIGAWLGTPVLGKWLPGVAYFPGAGHEEVYIIPAILGALALQIVAVDVFKMRG